MRPSAAYIVIICSFLMLACNVGSDFFLYHTAGPHYIHLSLALTLAISYLLYPLLGWLSDVYFTRYKVIRFAFVMSIVAMVLLVIGFVFFEAIYSQYYNNVYSYICEHHNNSPSSHC